MKTTTTVKYNFHPTLLTNSVLLMKKLKTGGILILLCFFQTFVFSQSEKMSLADATKYALENSNSVKVSLLNVKDTELAITQGKAQALPQITASSSYNFFLLTPKSVFPDFISPAVYGVLNTEGIKDGNGNLIQTRQPGPGAELSFVQKNQFSIGGQVSQLLYSAAYKVGLKAIDITRQLALDQLSSKNADIRNQVVDAYLPALIITEGAKTLDKNIKNLESSLKDAKATYKAGFIEQLDVDRLELSLGNLKTDRENLDRQKEQVLNALKLTIGYPIEKNLEPTDDINSLMPYATDAELSGVIDYKSRAEYNVLATQEKLATLQIDLNRAAYKPTVAGFVSFTENLNSNNYFTQTVYNQPQSVLGLTANVTLWDGYATKSKIERASLALKQLQYGKSDLERAITLQVINSRVAYTNAQRKLDNQQKSLTLAERIYDTTQKKYKNGIGSSLEVATAERDLYAAQQNVRQAQSDIISAYKSIQKSLGTN